MTTTMYSRTLSLIIVAGLAHAATADVWPHADGMMKHVMVSLEDQTLAVHLEGDPLERIELIRYPGEQYTAPADVLNDTFYGSRYGWLADGFIDLPAGAGIFVRNAGSTDGLSVYEGGMRSMIPMHTFAPILGTEGSEAAWMWGGTMVHNWYSAPAPGDYDAAYEVYVGDAATGIALDGYVAGEVTLRFTAVPAPGALALIGAWSLGLARRRGRNR